MPITHNIDHTRRWMETRAEGPISWADLEAHWAAEVEEGGELYPELVDGTAATIAFSPADIRRLMYLVQTEAESKPLGPTAILIRTDLGFGMIRMLGILLEPWCAIQPFRDRRSAEMWLVEEARRPATSPREGRPTAPGQSSAADTTTGTS